MYALNSTVVLSIVRRTRSIAQFWSVMVTANEGLHCTAAEDPSNSFLTEVGLVEHYGSMVSTYGIGEHKTFFLLSL
jgi:hypothetical protein